MPYINITSNVNHNSILKIYPSEILATQYQQFSNASFSPYVYSVLYNTLANPVIYDGYSSLVLSANDYSQYESGLQTDTFSLGYYNGNIYSVITPFYNGADTWSIFRLSQPNTGGLLDPAPALNRYDIIGTAIPGLEGFSADSPSIADEYAVLFYTNGNPEVYIANLTDSSVTYQNAFEMDTGFILEDLSQICVIIDGADYILCAIDTSIYKPVIIRYTPETYLTTFTYTKYAIEFDNSLFNNAISTGQFPLINTDGNSFFFAFNTPQINSAIKLTKDGTSYAQYDFIKESNFAFYVNGFHIDNSNNYYIIGGDDDGNSYRISIGIDNLTTKNPQPISLPCISPCIPLIKER